MNKKYLLRRRIQGAKFNPRTGKDNLRSLANQQLSYIEGYGFAADPDIRLEEQGLYILAHTCQRISLNGLKGDKDDRIKVFRFN